MSADKLFCLSFSLIKYSDNLWHAKDSLIQRQQFPIAQPMPGGQSYSEQFLFTGVWGGASTSRKRAAPPGRKCAFFAFVYTDALLATSIRNSGYKSLSRLLCYTDFSKKPHCTSSFGKKSRYNILSFNGKETRVFAKVGITKSIFPFLFFCIMLITG